MAGDNNAEVSATVPAKKRGFIRPVLLGLVLIAAIGVFANYENEWWNKGRFIISTDDAYVGAEMASVSSQISARIVSVSVEANQQVEKGDTLITLDDTDFKLAVEAATAKIATQRAEKARIENQIEASTVALDQVAVQGDLAIAQQSLASAQTDAAKADLARAQKAFDRIKALTATSAGSQNALDNANADLLRAKSNVASAAAQTASAAAASAGAKAALASAEANIEVLKAQRDEIDHVIAELQVAQEKAERDLSLVVIRAPIDGAIAAKSVQIGDFASVGKRLLSVVPLDKLYVDANFKETQLPNVIAGTPVVVHVDAFGSDMPIKGIIEGLSPGTGSVFSLLPPDNSTGNFTKIVQRVPVRISIEKPAGDAIVLRPGLSVTVELDTREAQRLLKPNPVAAANE